jgi:8-oxo-dGTP pyrophosphatase MutT (NUDIX family)
LIWSLRTDVFVAGTRTEVNPATHPVAPLARPPEDRYTPAMRGPVTFGEAVTRIRAALAERSGAPLEVAGFRAAAVLVALLHREGGPTLLFTRRTESVPSHKGEISFPGGAREPGEDAVRAALREAEEEVGLAPPLAEPLGALDDVPSIARFVVTPVVAAVRAPPAAFRPAEFEVSEPFELPLAALLDPGQRRTSLFDPALLPPELPLAFLRSEAARRIPFEEVDPATGHWKIRSFHADPARVVWGLTARILADLLDRAFHP